MCSQGKEESDVQKQVAKTGWESLLHPSISLLIQLSATDPLRGASQFPVLGTRAMALRHEEQIGKQGVCAAVREACAELAGLQRESGRVDVPSGGRSLRILSFLPHHATREGSEAPMSAGPQLWAGAGISMLCRVSAPHGHDVLDHFFCRKEPMRMGQGWASAGLGGGGGRQEQPLLQCPVSSVS